MPDSNIDAQINANSFELARLSLPLDYMSRMFRRRWAIAVALSLQRALIVCHKTLPEVLHSDVALYMHTDCLYMACDQTTTAP